MQLRFAEFVSRDATTVPLSAADRDGAIGELVAALGRSGAIPESAVPTILENLLARERAGTTGFGRGVAVPHCKCPHVERMTCAVGLSAVPLEFGALDGKPVLAVFVLLSPQGNHEGHLAAMETIFRSLDQQAFRLALRDARTPEDVLALLDEADRQPRKAVGLGRGA